MKKEFNRWWKSEGLDDDAHNREIALQAFEVGWYCGVYSMYREDMSSRKVDKKERSNTK